MGVVTRSQSRELRNQYQQHYKERERFRGGNKDNDKRIIENTFEDEFEQEKYDCAVILCSLRNNFRKEYFKNSIIEFANQLADRLVKEM